MKAHSIVITDIQAASLIQRGTAHTLTLFEADVHDLEQGTYIPAKSITLSNTKGLIELRDMLIRANLEGRE